MSSSHMYRVPSNLALAIESEIAHFQRHNPTIAMGVEARRARFRALRKSLMADPELCPHIRAAGEHPAKVTDEVLTLLQQQPPKRAIKEYIKICSIERAQRLLGQPRVMTFSTMVTQLLQEALHSRELAKAPTVGAYPHNLREKT